MTMRIVAALLAARASDDAAHDAVIALAGASERVRAKQRRRDALPMDKTVLVEIEGAKPLSSLSPAARTEVACAAFTFLPGRFGAPFMMPAGWALAEDTQTRLSALPEATQRILRDAVAGRIVDDQKRPSSPINQATGFTYRMTKRGQPPRFADFDFACCCYVVFLESTETKPGRVWDPINDKPAGKFHEFMAAAFDAFGFGKDWAGLDRTVREVVAWMAPEGVPDKSEIEHAHRFWLNRATD